MHHRFARPKGFAFGKLCGISLDIGFVRRHFDIGEQSHARPRTSLSTTLDSKAFFFIACEAEFVVVVKGFPLGGQMSSEANIQIRYWHWWCRDGCARVGSPPLS
jgi:hypothetical protein